MTAVRSGKISAARGKKLIGERALKLAVVGFSAAQMLAGFLRAATTRLRSNALLAIRSSRNYTRFNLPEEEDPVKKVCFAVSLALAATGSALAQEKTIKIAGFGAKSGVVRSFGVNSEAAMLAAADVINKQGGVKLADGSKAK